MSTMAIYYFWIPTSPEPAACLYYQNTSERHAGCLAIPASYHSIRGRLPKRKHGQHHRGARVHRSCLSDHAEDRSEFGFGYNLGNATAIPRADASVALVGCGSGSRLILGWIRPASGIPFVVWRSISGFTKPTFVCHSPQLSPPFKYSPFRIHFTRWDGRCPLLIDQPRSSFA